MPKPRGEAFDVRAVRVFTGYFCSVGGFAKDQVRGGACVWPALPAAACSLHQIFALSALKFELDLNHFTQPLQCPGQQSVVPAEE